MSFSAIRAMLYAYLSSITVINALSEGLNCLILSKQHSIRSTGDISLVFIFSENCLTENEQNCNPFTIDITVL